MSAILPVGMIPPQFLLSTPFPSGLTVVGSDLYPAPSHRACYGVLRFIMESGAKGCEVIVSGKLRAQRAKAMKFKDGYMISSGHPVNEYIDGAVRHVMLRQGVLGIKVRSSGA